MTYTIGIDIGSGAVKTVLFKVDGDKLTFVVDFDYNGQNIKGRGPVKFANASYFNEDGSPTARTKSIWGHTPMNRFGESHELIGACLFLASHKASSFVTGTDIRVDGGFLSQTI